MNETPEYISTEVLLNHMWNLKQKEIMNDNPIQHSFIYVSGLEHLSDLLFGKHRYRELITEINQNFEKKLRRKFWKGIGYATIIFVVLAIL